MYDEDDLLALSGIQHFAFCRRQWALIHVEQNWVESYLTASGQDFHSNVHDGLLREKRKGQINCRALPIVSYRLGLYGVCDMVEFHQAQDGMTLAGEKGFWQAFPVEYKRGKIKEGMEDLAQVVAQAMALEEMLEYPVRHAFLYYGGTKRREEILITEEHIKLVTDMSREMHDYHKRGYTPSVKEGKKCKSCSLYGICIPSKGEKFNIDSYYKEFDL